MTYPVTVVFAIDDVATSIEDLGDSTSDEVTPWPQADPIPSRVVDAFRDRSILRVVHPGTPNERTRVLVHHAASSRDRSVKFVAMAPDPGTALARATALGMSPPQAAGAVLEWYESAWGLRLLDSALFVVPERIRDSPEYATMIEEEVPGLASTLPPAVEPPQLSPRVRSAVLANPGLRRWSEFYYRHLLGPAPPPDWLAVATSLDS